MKVKTIVKGLAIALAITSLAACSSMGKKNTSVSDASGGGAQATGAGDNANFGNDGAGGAEAQNKRVYYFEFDKSDIREDDRPAIEANANRLISNTGAKILLEGHTDPRGSREYNVALGERRANAVLDFLKAKGVNPDQIRVISYGAERLAVPGRNEDDFQQDRRVVLVYLQS